MKKSEITCERCGNNLYMMNTKDYIRYMEKKGYLKKENRAVSTMASLLMPKPFYCKECEDSFPFYSTIGKACFHVEPLPTGAIPIYGMGSPCLPVIEKEKKKPTKKQIAKKKEKDNDIKRVIIQAHYERRNTKRHKGND